jgi:hypothetical protein
MTRMMVNALSATVLAVGGLFFGAKKADAQHAEYHQGSSCGTCHCEQGMECAAPPNQGCSCTWPDPEESN